MNEKQKNTDEHFCPSYRCEDGAYLLGVRQKSGIVAILPVPLQIDNSFIVNAQESDVPAQQRFRFAGNCIESACKNWTSKGCGVAIRIKHFFSENHIQSIPDCSIRNKCRWFQQEGINICSMCPKVITEVTAEEIDQYFNEKIKSVSVG